MPTPVEMCIEDRGASSARFTRCVALAGRQAGLRLDARGEIRWKREEAAAIELWISADERLMAYRRADAPPVRLRRRGRSFDLPAERPVVVLDQDELDIGERSLRLHLHGPTQAVHPPAPVAERSWWGPGKVAAAVAFGAAVAGCPELEIRDNPPEAIDPTTTLPHTGGAGAGGGGGGGAGDGGGGGIGGEGGSAGSAGEGGVAGAGGMGEYSGGGAGSGGGSG